MEKTIIVDVSGDHMRELIEFPKIIDITDSFLINGHLFTVREKITQLSDMNGHVTHSILCHVVPAQTP